MRPADITKRRSAQILSFTVVVRHKLLPLLGAEEALLPVGGELRPDGLRKRTDVLHLQLVQALELGRQLTEGRTHQCHCLCTQP